MKVRKSVFSLKFILHVLSVFFSFFLKKRERKEQTFNARCFSVSGSKLVHKSPNSSSLRRCIAFCMLFKS